LTYRQMRLHLALAALAIAASSCVSQSSAVRAAPPQPPMSAFERQIRNARDAGDGDYQLRTLREKVAAQPDNVAARLELAKAYQDRGYPDVALEICRLASARFPESGDVEIALVKALRQLNQRTEAIASLEAFLKLHPQTAPSFTSWLGILYDETGRYGLGEPSHRDALVLAPNEDYLHNNLGYNLLMQKKNADAAAEFREALRLNPASQTARNNLGIALAGENANQQAVANWQAATDAATAHSNLAALLIEKGNYVEARKELEIALGYNRENPAALRNLELVSRLDGNPATVPAVQSKTRSERFRASFKRIFVGPLNDSGAAPAIAGRGSAEQK
jgi:Flp pilus assembly protein TadD